MPSLPPPPQRLFAQADGWFARARAALLGAIPCQRGCARCCIGPFAITTLDEHALQHGLAMLPPSDRRDIREQARRQTAAMEQAFPRLIESPSLAGWRDDEVDRVLERFAELPCPALDHDGTCRVYSFRPVTCRMMGIPIEENGLIHGACEVQTAVPILPLPRALRLDEARLAELEATDLGLASTDTEGSDPPGTGDEILLPYGFLDRRPPTPMTAPRILDSAAKGVIR